MDVTTFKKGDRVEITKANHNPNNRNTVGERGVITDNDWSTPEVCWDTDGAIQSICSSRIKKVSPGDEFKEGDKVVFTETNPDGGVKYGEEGNTATINRWCSFVGDDGEYEVIMDEGQGAKVMKCFVPATSIALRPPAAKPKTDPGCLKSITVDEATVLSVISNLASEILGSKVEVKSIQPNRRDYQHTMGMAEPNFESWELILK